ncbi:DNA-directed RNA polymerase subunit beta [Gryllotalpicola koreensis]|uniref:DNA-directed RNA polymerase subunit beta n=1 Tax=Gryllotalpicola koreensis TaxID=993086 RepID=A0ABP8A416_9MICO
MADDFHKPVKLPSRVFEAFHGGQDPAVALRVAHETAHALVSRVHADPDPAVIDRLVDYTDRHGIDAIAELWSEASARSLPGALWRVYLVRVLIRQNPEETSYLYQRGADVTPTIDPIVAGAQEPTGPTEIVELADRILRGAFEGDFADALDRAAAFCRVEAAGAAALADSVDAVDSERATELTTRASRFVQTGDELGACARLWRAESLD